MAMASEWWVSVFGAGVQDARDYTFRPIKKSAYNQPNSKYGWVLEYYIPLDKGGSRTPENIHIVSYEAYVLRDGRLTYSIDGIRYQVQRDHNGSYKIYILGDKKMDFWEKEFGNVKVAKDFAGREIHRAEYHTSSPFSWDVDHIQPEAKNGPDSEENKQIVNSKTNDEKADKTTFSINGTTYQVKKTKHANKRDWAEYDYSQKKYCIVEIEQ